MVRASYFVFGYRELSVPKESSGALVSLFLKLGISSSATAHGTYIVTLRDFSVLRPYLDRVGASAGEPKGLPTLLGALRLRYPCVLALVFAVIVNFLLSGIVWDIRISGNSAVPDYVIKEALADSGLSVGSVWSRLDRSMIEAEASAALTDIGWLNIHRRGTVAYVEVVERAQLPPKEEVNSAPCNIVAELDCVIEDIDVTSGTAVVSPGDVVRRGDVLISGVVESESGVTFVAASGTVTGQVGGTVSASASRFETVKSVSGRSLAELRVNIFNFSVNIFKNYRNSSASCDIIVKNESFVVKNSYRLPFGLTKCYEVTYSEIPREYTDAELVTLAIGRHNAALAARLANGELVKISTSGEYTENGYTVSSDVIYSVSVGERL